MPVKLFYNEMSPPCRAVLMTAKALAIELELGKVNIYTKEQVDENLMRLNPEYTIPTMVDNDVVIWDSHEIVRYLVDKYGEDDNLYPKDSSQRALVDQKLNIDAETLFPRINAIIESVNFHNFLKYYYKLVGPMSCLCRSSLPTCPQYSEIQEKYAQIFHILRKLTELLESELLSCLTGREFELFDHYFSMEPQAHFVNDLPFVCRLLELIPEKMYVNEVFEEYYEKYLLLCGVPPLMLVSSESLSCGKDLEEFFSILGGLLLYLKKEKHRSILLDSIMNILSSKIRYPRCYVSPVKLQHAAAESLLPKIIGRFLSFASDEMYERLLQISISLARTSDLACFKMIEEGAVDSLLTHLDPSCKTMTFMSPIASFNFHICHYEESSTLVWLLLKSLKGSTPEDISKLPPPSRFAFWSLRSGLKYFYTKKRSRVDRNNIVAILLKIVEIFPDTEFVQSGLARDIIELNLVVENDALSDNWSGIQITPSMEDFVFVRLLLMFLYYFDRPEYYGGIHYLRDTSIIGLKMKLVTHSQAVKWHKDHLGALISIVVGVFAQTALYTVEIFLAEKGIIKFMEILLEKEHNIDVYLSLLRSLIIMGRMDDVKSKMILNRLLDVRAQVTLMEYCESIKSKETLDSKSQLAVAYSFAILEKLFKSKTTLCNKRLMDLSIDYLKRIRSPWAQDPFIIPQLPIMIISCLWNILLCDEQNLKQFIQEEGIYICLDLAETCVYPVKVVAFGLLTEVCAESLAAPFFITWRGGKHQKILPFLLEIFREENRMLGAKHTTSGLIEEIELPLMGVEQYENLCDPKNSLHASPSISDMIGSCRPKIYAILDMLTFVHEERVRMANEIYKTWNQDLSVEDQITKVIAENFFALKIAEVWDEIQLHIERNGIRPLASDYEMLTLVVNRAKKWGAFIQASQKEILRSNRENEMIRENAFYMDLREARLGQTLGASCELEYIARCTREIYRIRAKRKHNAYLMEVPVKKTDPNILYHTTFMYDILVNPIFDQILHISNLSNNPARTSSIKGPMTARMRKAMQKYHKAKFEDMPGAAEDELWGSITDVSSIVIENEKEISTDKISAITEAYKLLDAFLEDKTYLAGDCLTIADFCCVATVSTATIIIPISTEKYPNLSTWYRNFKNFEYYEETNGEGLSQLDALVELKLGRPRNKELCD